MFHRLIKALNSHYDISPDRFGCIINPTVYLEPKPKTYPLDRFEWKYYLY